MHDPAKKNERRAARKRGYANSVAPVEKIPPKVLPPKTPDVKLDTAEDVKSLLAETISQVRRGELEPRIGNTIAGLVNVALRAREQGEIESRLNKIEELVYEKGKVSGAGISSTTRFN